MSAAGHSIRFQTVPNKAMESDGKQGLIIPVYLQLHGEVLSSVSPVEFLRGCNANCILGRCSPHLSEL